ncbi:Hint domain-containing protein [Aliiroseovarius halocynthiae]|nr:Hint domain-containing protein [Aliiroseovarius halocynthiae]
MATFIANGSDILSNPNVSSNSSGGQDGAGQMTVQGGQQIFPDEYLVEFEVQDVLPSGEFDGQTKFVKVTVYASVADYNAGNATYTYNPQNPGQWANVQSSVDGIGDSYVRFNANVLVSSDPNAPSLNTIFVAPGSNVANTPNMVFDHHTDIDYDNDGSIDANTTEDGNGFFNIANSQVVCFTNGTFIQTPAGERPIETLKKGDWVTTADNGPQRILWIGGQPVHRNLLKLVPKLRPILIPEGVLGATRRTLVSRQHAILDSDQSRLVRAIRMTKKTGSRMRIANGVREVTYFHILFENHEVIFANGVASESYFPGNQALRMLTPRLRRQVYEIFPRLSQTLNGRQDVHDVYGAHARPML